MHSENNRSEQPKIKKNSEQLLEDLSSYLKSLFINQGIRFIEQDNKTICLDPMDYSKVVSLSHEMKQGGFVFRPLSYQYLCGVYLNEENKSCIQLLFTLDSEKYTSSSHDIKNDKILGWAYDALIRTIDSYEHFAHSPLQDGTHSKEGMHPFLPYNISWFLHHLQDAYEISEWVNSAEKRPLKFLEIGCGVGTKIKLASFLFDAYAIEFFQPYAMIAQHINKKIIRRNFGVYRQEKNVERIFVTDALQYENYGQFDVIYLFCPFDDFEKEILLENRLLAQAKEGAVFILVWHQTALPSFIRKTSAPSGHIYVKMRQPEKFFLLEEFVAKNLHSDKN